MKVYFDFDDWWVGYYRGSQYHFVCPLPTIVIRWRRNEGRNKAQSVRACAEIAVL